MRIKIIAASWKSLGVCHKIFPFSKYPQTHKELPSWAIVQSEFLVLWSLGVHKQFSLLGFTWLYDQNIVLSVYFEFLPIEDGSVPKQKNVNDFKWLWDPPVTHISKNHYYHTERQQQKLMKEQKVYCENMARLWSRQPGDPSFVFVYCDIALEL